MATFNVTNSLDNGLGDTVGTLSYAIKQANEIVGDDTIVLDTNVRLTGATATTGFINSNITINGNGNSISGDANGNGSNDSGDVRALLIQSGIVNLSNLTITNGRAQGSNGGGNGGGGAGMGGGLFIFDGNVSLSNVTFSNNSAIGGNNFGGGGSGGIGGIGGNGSNGGNGGNGSNGGNGIGSNGGSGAGFGGGLFIRSGSLTLTNSTFTNNTATGGTGVSNGQGLGGAIFAMKSTTNTNGNNTGMPTVLPTVTLNSVQFSNNDADNANDNIPSGTITSGTDLNNNDVFGNTIVGNTIEVSNANNAPTGLTLSSTTVAENQASGTVIGDLSSTDPDTGSTFTYSLVIGTGDTDNSLFTITNNQLKTNAVFDFETKNSYKIRVKTTDQDGLSFEQQLTIGVSNANDAPVITSAATASFAENGTSTVHTVTATDQDAGATLTYSLSGTDANLFNININNGAVTFQTAPNFELPSDSGANNIYDINVIASDGASTATQAVAITVTNVNDDVQSSSSYTLNSSQIDLALTGTANINGTGNSLNNVLFGNSGNNILDGRAGADTMSGGTGNDFYYVDNISDSVIELANQGIDKVFTTINYTLTANVEDLGLQGTATNGTGNELNNTITGNELNNVLTGLAGDDTLMGGVGADTMTGGTGNDWY